MNSQHRNEPRVCFPPHYASKYHTQTQPHPWIPRIQDSDTDDTATHHFVYNHHCMLTVCVSEKFAIRWLLLLFHLDCLTELRLLVMRIIHVVVTLRTNATRTLFGPIHNLEILCILSVSMLEVVGYRSKQTVLSGNQKSSFRPTY